VRYAIFGVHVSIRDLFIVDIIFRAGGERESVGRGESHHEPWHNAVVAVIESLFAVFGISGKVFLLSGLPVTLVPERDRGVEICRKNLLGDSVLSALSQVVADSRSDAMPTVGQSTAFETELVKPVHGTVVVVENVVTVLVAGSVVGVLK
jgi:hypothetical protein